jgi:5-(carboxyamino)imidazole ribonucleotide synthase
MTAVGIVGGGQLARMLALAGLPLGLRFVILDPAPDACAATLGEHLRGDYDDRERLVSLAQRADVITYEFENVPETSISFLAERVAVFPGAASLATARDRLREKMLFRELGIPAAPFAAVDSLAELERAAATIGLPAVLKTRTLGYDGKGQAVLRRPEDLAAAWTRLGGVPLIVEGFVDFRRELSALGVRARDGETAFYPLAENVHTEGILRLSRSRPGDPAEAQAQDSARRVFDHLDHVGMFALEFFEAGDALLANEIAPRVHNSGHWTIEGAQTSQFENHLRAILGLPVGSTAACGHAAMVNIIGEPPDLGPVLAVPGAHLHLYGKRPRPGRKLGHATVRASNARDLEASLQRLLRVIEPRSL